MDVFSEKEEKEGVRWNWSKFPSSKSDASSLVCPPVILSAIGTRLLRETQSGAWHTCVPKVSFDLTFGATEFWLLLRQHLGLTLLDQSATGNACPECRELTR